MESELDAVLSETTATPEPAAEAVEPQAEATGETGAAPAQTQEDPAEKEREGLRAAALAERRKRQEAEQRAAAIEAKLAELQKPQVQQTEDTPPDPAAYQDSPQEYWAKLARYEARQELKAERERQAAEAKEREQRGQEEQFLQAAQKAVEAGNSEFKDFDVTINSGLAPFMTPHMQRALVMAPNGHRLAYHLAKNPAEAARIARLDPASMLMELGEMRAKVQAPQQQTVPQTLTQARDTRGQYARPGGDGITPLDAVLGR